MIDGKKYTAIKYRGLNYRDRDDIYAYFVENHLKLYLEKEGINQTEFLAEINKKIAVMKKGYTRMKLSNERRVSILSRANNNLKLFKSLQYYKKLYATDRVKYGNDFKRMLITFYITNYSPDLLDMTEP
jgi:hypothetical protein